MRLGNTWLLGLTDDAKSFSIGGLKRHQSAENPCKWDAAALLVHGGGSTNWTNDLKTLPVSSWWHILLVTWMWCKTCICRLYGYRLLSGGGEGMRGRHDFIGGMEMRRKRGRVMYFNQHSFFFLPIVCLKDHQTPLVQTLFWLFFLIYGWRKRSFLFTFALELFPIRSN